MTRSPEEARLQASGAITPKNPAEEEVGDEEENILQPHSYSGGIISNVLPAPVPGPTVLIECTVSCLLGTWKWRE